MGRTMGVVGGHMIPQDTAYLQYFKLVANLVREHSTSYCHYAFNYPGVLAALLGEDVARRDTVRQNFKVDVEAFAEASKVKTAPVEALLRRHPFKWTAMQWCIMFAKASDFELTGNHQWAEWLSVVFRSQTGTVAIEQSNQVLRDHETRDSSNKVMQHLSVWEHLMESGILGRHDRKEIRVESTCAPPPGFGESLFQTTRRAGEELSKLDLDGILKNPTSWPSYSAQSQKDIYGQIMALRFLHQTSQLQDAAELWCVKLLPDLTAVHHKPSGKYLFVLQVSFATYDPLLAPKLKRVTSVIKPFLRRDTHI